MTDERNDELSLENEIMSSQLDSIGQDMRRWLRAILPHDQKRDGPMSANELLDRLIALLHMNHLDLDQCSISYDGGGVVLQLSVRGLAHDR